MLRWMASGVALAVASVWVAAAPVPNANPELPKKQSVCFGLLVVTVRDGVVQTITPTSVEGNTGVRLWDAPLRPDGRAKVEGTSRTFRGWAFSGVGLGVLHWRIAHDHVWSENGFIGGSASYHIPLADLPALDAENEERGAAKLHKKYADEAAHKASWFLTDFTAHTDKLVRRLLNERLGTDSGQYPPVALEYDFLPTGPKAWDGFQLYDSSLTIFRCSLKSRDQRSPDDVPLPVGCEEWAGPFNAGFQEPFLAYGESGSPFFVTKSGKVFRCLYPEGKEPRVQKVWDDDKRPVTTILNDADTNRTFVAGRDLPEGPDKWFYFELADKVEKKPFDRAAVAATAEEPLKSALLFARFLAKEGQVKDKPR